MAGENNILDDFELDLDIETITLDDIDISVIDEMGDSSFSAVSDEDMNSLSLEGMEEQSSPPLPLEEKIDEDDTLSAELPVESIGAVETLNIINETPEPAIIEEREIKPVEEIRTEVQDKTFDGEHALQEAYIFNADDEIISIDGSELDQVIYGVETQDLGTIEVIDQEDEVVESPPDMDEKEEVLMEVSSIIDNPSNSELNKSVELSTLDQDSNYELQMETVKTEIKETQAEESSNDFNFDDEEEPIALSMQELNDIEVSEDALSTEEKPAPAVTESYTSNLESPLNDGFDFSPTGEAGPLAMPESIDIGEEISIPDAPTDIQDEEVSQNTPHLSGDVDVEELYSIYNGENAIKAEMDESVLETSSDEIPDFSNDRINVDISADDSQEEMEVIEIAEDDLLVPLTDDYEEDDSLISESFDEIETLDELPSDLEEVNADAVVFDAVEAELISESMDELPSDLEDEATDDVVFESIGDDLISEESIETYETAEMQSVSDIYESENNITSESLDVTDDITDIQEEVLSTEDIPEEADYIPNISTEESELEADENIPLEEEIAITQNEFIEMATLEESENKGEINEEDLDQVRVDEPTLARQEELTSVSASDDDIVEIQDLSEFEEIEDESMDTENNLEVSLEEEEMQDISAIEDDGIEEIDLDEISVSDEILIDDLETKIETIDNSFTTLEMEDETDIIAHAPDAEDNNIMDTLPVPGDLDEEHVELEQDEISEIDDIMITDENVTPEMYSLNSSQIDKEQIIAENVNKLSSDTKDEMKRVLSYLDTLLEDLPEDKIKEFSQSDYYDLYVKILDKLGV